MNFTIKQIADMISGAFKPIAAKIKDLEQKTEKLNNDKGAIEKAAQNALQGLNKNTALIEKQHSWYEKVKLSQDKQGQIIKQNHQANESQLTGILKELRNQDNINESTSQHLMAKVDKADFIKELTEFKQKQSQGVEHYKQGNDYYPGESVSHNGGVYQVINKTNSEPGTTANWLLTQNGIKECTAKSFSLVFELTNGETVELTDLKGDQGDGLNFKGLHCPGETYHKNDICVTDGAAWIAVKETTNTPPLTGWKLFVKRGPRGKQGPGPDETKLNNLIDDQLTKMMAHDIQPLIKKAFDQAVNSSMTWQGIWRNDKNYKAGDVVRVSSALFVCMQNSLGRAPDNSPQDWSFIIRNGGGSSGASAGGGVSSVFGRSGNVTAQAGDYTANEINYDNSISNLAATDTQTAIDIVYGLLYQHASLRTSALTAQTFDNVSPAIIDIFDELTTDSLFVTGDEISNTITVNVDGYFEVLIALNAVFPGAEELQVFIYVNGIAYSATPISIQGLGNGKPTELYWTSLTPLSAGDVIDVRGLNGDAGSFNCDFIRSRFSIEYKGVI